MSLQFGGLIKYFIRKCSEKNVQKVCTKNFRISYWRWGPDCASYFLMRQLFLRTTNLLVLLFLFDKTMSFSLAIFFLSLLTIWPVELLVAHLILNIWQSFGYGLWDKRKEKYLFIRKRNNITSYSRKCNSWKSQLSQIKSYRFPK